MIKLSVVIITLNEEKNIGRCLDAIKDIADDILVVDSYSTDKTEAICKEKGARFIQHPFEGYTEQKNVALDEALYDHVLSLDADEIPSEELLESLKKVKENWDADGYSMNRLTNYCGAWIHHCSWYPDRKLRLVDRKTARWEGHRIHESLNPQKDNYNEVVLKGDLLHYSFYTVEEHHRQVEKFTDIGALADFEKGKRSNHVKMILSPVVKFIRDYFMKLGILDGIPGLRVCWISAGATRKKYVKLWKHQQDAKKNGK
ncbi:MAG: glycosyltransferase family 2 protein [Hyphomicrobiales bacterium]